MKSLLLTAVFALFATSVFSQKMASQLQSKKWYVNGEVNGSTLKLSPTPSKAGYDWEAKFSHTESLHNCQTLKKTIVDATGIEQKAGTYFCDSVYYYRLKNDLISINYLADSYFYKIKILPNSEGIELAPISAAEFK